VNSTEFVDTPSSDRDQNRWDYVLVGGGLQSGLMALAILHHQPSARLALIEEGPRLAGNHTWSFHLTDLPPMSRQWAHGLIESQWPGYEIIAGGRTRQVNIPYATCSSTHFAEVITAKLHAHSTAILTGTTATELTSHGVRLSDGRCLNAKAVLDNRGPTPLDKSTFRGGFQKFYGFELELDQDWICPNPIVMDDRVDQTDGFRFIYSLPMERRRVLVEDTRFSNTPTIDRSECLAQVEQYLSQRGCIGYRIVREETGVLPMPISGYTPGYALPALAGGYRGGWFHAATGYSFAMAVQVAEMVATTPAQRLREGFELLSQQHAGRAKFARFLNRLLFELVKPRTRYQIFRRFYRVLDEPAIARFYGHHFTWSDAFRIVVGIPPRGLRPINFAKSFFMSRSQPSNYPPAIRKKVPA
jgi:lycopene beta-cyclase